MTHRSVAILGFHKVGHPPPPPAGWESWFYVSEAALARFLRVLRDEAFEPIDLSRFLLGLDEPESLPERSALVTFDDGDRSICERALPVLQCHDVPAVLFVPTRYVGGRNAFDLGVEPEELLCDWRQLRALRAGGVAIQSHGHTHRAFSSLDEAEREEELVRSKELLEEQIGEPIETIAFPYGDPGPEPARAQAVAAGYRAAFTYRGGPIRLPVTDRYRIERIAMGPTTDLRAELRGLA